jgi:prefoldin subunit 5
MMNWMRNYDPRMEDMTDDEKIKYLKKQRASISEVSEKMNKSIAEAEEYLK